MRKKFEKNTPDIVSYLIVLFFDDRKMIPCNVHKSTVINDDFGVDRVSLRSVMDMIVGESAQYFMTLDNNLYVTGNNASGQLGLSESCLTMNNMTQLEYFKNDDMKCKFIGTGLDSKHCFVYTVNKELYGFGWNKDGQLGCTNKNEWKPVLIKHDFKADLIGISCGYYHTLFLTNNGNVFACGNNRYNQTQRNNQGLYSSDDDQGIFQIKALQNISHIKCGGFSSYAIDKHKTIHSFGYNDSGECGCGFTGTIENIQKIPNINCITLDSGSFHVGCLTDNNSIYMFGYNANGQCGNSSKTSYHTPNKLNIKISSSFIDVKCGNTFTIIMDLEIMGIVNVYAIIKHHIYCRLK